jgi:hypothetical protein
MGDSNYPFIPNIEEALAAVGEVLSLQGVSYSIVVVGGAALNLLGLIQRPTRDVDVLAFADGRALRAPPEPLPQALLDAVASVAAELKRPVDWLNTVVALQWRQGIPPGFASRVEWREFGALRVGLASRYDMIFFKLYAMADDGPTGRHAHDLIALKPTADELSSAAEWIATQDPSPGFAAMLDRAIRYAVDNLS